MVRIRLTRTGRKNSPFFRIGVYDSLTRRDGRYLELLGSYDPGVKEANRKIKLQIERYQHWLQRGARPTPALERLLSHAGILSEAAKTPH